MSDKIVRQLVIDGPAHGQVIKRPISEAQVYLPWQEPDTSVSANVTVKGGIVTYHPFVHYVFGQRITVLARYAYDDDVVIAALLNYAVRKLTKETDE